MTGGRRHIGDLWLAHFGCFRGEDAGAAEYYMAVEAAANPIIRPVCEFMHQLIRQPNAFREGVKMIRSKEDLLVYLDADKKALSRTGNRPSFMDHIWKYEVLLRKCEYYANCPKGIAGRLLMLWYKYKRSVLGSKCGFSVPINTTGKGLCLSHMGSVIISEYARIGENCRMHAGINIGADFRVPDAAPRIGNNVYIGPGAKLFGAIEIADGIAVGANAVVNKSFTEENISIGGVPAKKISDRGTEGVLF